MSKEEDRQRLIKLVNDKNFIRLANEQKSDMDKDLLTPRLGPSGVFYYGLYMDGGAEIPEIYIENINRTDGPVDILHRTGIYKYVIRDDTITPKETEIFVSKEKN